MRTHSDELRKRADFSEDLDKLITSYSAVGLETLMSDAEAVLAGRRKEPSDNEILNLEQQSSYS